MRILLISYVNSLYTLILLLIYDNVERLILNFELFIVTE